MVNFIPDPPNAEMGIAVIGGLVFSTIVTMVLVPVGYVLIARHGERDKKHKVAFLTATKPEFTKMRTP